MPRLLLILVCAGAGLCLVDAAVPNFASRASADADGGVPAPDQAERGSRGEEAFKQALARLKAPEPAERARAADELGQRGYRFRQPISEALRPMLKSDPDPLVRAAAGRALGRLGVREAVPELVSALEDRSVEVRVVAAAALWRLPDPSAVPALLARSEDKDKAVREWSALALGVAADPRALPVMIRLLGDPERPVRLAAVRSLGRIGRPDGLDPLVQYVKTGKRDEEEKDEVINSVVSISGPEREPALLRVLSGASSDAPLRARVALALGKVGEEPSVPVLRKLSAKDGTPAVRSAAKEALSALQDRLKGATHALVTDAAARP
ncbi:MAG: repeat protein [Myxococcaceae bacterium]|nr:repeat protein [Myxococcaceae bacterium]